MSRKAEAAHQAHLSHKPGDWHDFRVLFDGRGVARGVDLQTAKAIVRHEGRKDGGRVSVRVYEREGL